MLDPAVPLLVIVESVRDLPLAASHLFRIGYDRVIGYLHEGMTSWQNAGLPLRTIEQWSVHELNRRRTMQDLTILDVRSDQEWSAGHVPGAIHVPITRLNSQLDQLDRDKLIVTYCGTGYRASIAASLLARAGFSSVANVPGSWAAWQAAGFPIES
jgi:hydroxyacylglutathione hydrolase